MYKTKEFNTILGCGIYLLFLIMMVAVLSFKCNYHIDELLTYSLSNHRGGMRFSIEDGKKYTSVEKLYLNYLTVQPGQQFDYYNVWKNQSEDVHPPFYYALLHTICSFFPKTFSNWFAGSINIVFALLTLLILRKLSCYFLYNTFFINGLSIAFVFSAGILSSSTFLRMYIAAMFWVTMLAYCYVRKINEKEDDSSFLIKVAAVTLFGALTHYFCIIYAVLTSVLYGVYLLMDKKYKETCCFCLAMAGTGILSCLIFPAMLKHIFWGYRGKEVLQNAGNLSDLLGRLKYFTLIIDGQLFGRGGSVILIIFVLILLYTKSVDVKECVKPDRIMHDNLIASYLFILIPVFLYFTIISKIAVYQEERYLVPVYALTFWTTVMLLVSLQYRLLPKKWAKATMVLFLFVITIGSWMNTKWNYLFLSSKPLLESAAGYKDADCICFYKKKRDTLLVYLEVKNYKSLRFVSVNNETAINSVIKDVKDSDSNIIIVKNADISASEHTNRIKAFKEFKSYLKIGSWWGMTSYVLYK